MNCKKNPNIWTRAVFVLLAMLCFSTAWAQVSYRKYNTETGEFETKTSPASIQTVTSSTTTMSSGWYAVTENVTVNSRIEASGTVHLILCNSAKLTVTGGIYVPSNAPFNIYAQSDGENAGALDAGNNTGMNACIGGNSFQQSNSIISIHGGIINARSQNVFAAGIGGGNLGTGIISIYGGVINATGGGNAAGIGDGHAAGLQGKITILGGTIYATAGSEAQAIGAGKDTSTGTKAEFGDVAVYAKDATTPVVSTSRESICRSGYVKVTPCENHVFGTSHRCNYCNAVDIAACRAISLVTNTAGGNVVCPKMQLPGETVTLTMTANDYYSIGTVKYNDGSDHEISPVDGKCTFTMPNADVTVSVVFDCVFSQDSEGNMLVKSTDDWNRLATLVNNGMTFGGKTLKLANDITVTTMVGASGKSFSGTFDGGGNTITAKLSGDGEGVALFYQISGATIQNVNVTGDITSSKYRPATFASFVAGNCTIKNCQSNVNVKSTYATSSWIDGGAFVARVNTDASLTMTDCAFTGTVAYHSNGYEGGSMVGWTQANASAKLQNCLYAPSAITVAKTNDKSYIFVSGNVRGSLTSCYYNMVANGTSSFKKEGTFAYTEAPDNTLCKKATILNHEVYMPCTISGVDETFILTDGQDVSIVPVVQYNGADVASDNYTVTYEHNGEAVTEVAGSGTYTITMTGNEANSYSGTWSKTFTVQNGYTITYDANGGTGAPEAQTKVEGTDLTLATTEPTRNGYKFTGWCTVADGSCNTHEFVDLGLPSGLKWATCNVGASKPEEYGDYFAWGETKAYGEEDASNATNYSYNSSSSYVKTYYSWSTYKYCNGSSSTMTKYCTNSSWGTVDNITTLDLADDAARANWGGDWRMPTHDEFTELCNNCTTTWTTVGSVYGHLFTSNNNGNTLFLPAAGYRSGTSLSYAGSGGSYCSSSLYSDDPYLAWHLSFYSSYMYPDSHCDGRYYGRSVRAVTAISNYAAGATYTADAPATLYAQWELDASQWSEITVADDVQNGTVTVSTDKQAYGDKVTVTVTPDAGYYVTAVTYSDGTESHTITPVDGQYTFTVPSANSITVSATFANGFGQDAEGNYVIATTEAWNSFASQVAGGTTFSGKTVKLIDDISVTTKVGVVSGSSRTKPFSGTFDGGDHTLNDTITDTNNQGTAPFCFIKNATIRNLTVTGKVTGNAYHAAAIVGFAEGTSIIKNCAATATVNGSSHVGGILGHGLNSNITIDSCVFAGKIEGGNNAKGVLFGWGDNGGTKKISNSLYVMQEGQNTSNLDLGKRSGGSESYTNCYKTASVGSYGTVVLANVSANNIGKQYTIYKTHYYQACTVGGMDDYYDYTGEPISIVPTVQFNGTDLEADDYTVSITRDGEPVESVKERGQYTLSVTGNEERGYYGTWSKTLAVTQELTPDGEGIYHIASTDDWNDFAAMTVRGESFDGKTVALDNDITAAIMAGTEEYPFSGTFDGGGNTLTFNYTTNADNAAPFQWIKNATIKNMTVTGEITTSKMFAAGFVARGHGDNTIQDCVSNVTIHASKVGDGTHGGFVGRLESDCKTFTFTRCMFNGTLDGSNTDNWCGFAAWTMGEGNTNFVFNDCLFVPTSVNVRNGTGTFYRNGTPTLNGAYYIESIWDDQGQKAYINMPDGGLYKKATIVGQSVYVKCSVPFEDTFFDDKMPITTVYGDFYKVTIGDEDVPAECVTAKFTDNEGQEMAQVTTTGNYVLTVSGNEAKDFYGSYSQEFTVVKAFKADENGIYVIASAADWLSFAKTCEKKGEFFFKDKVVKLANDITVSKVVKERFRGTLDGCGHKLTLNIAEVGDGAALFNEIYEATVRNVYVDGSITSDGKYTATFAKKAYASCHFNNVHVSAAISSTYSGDYGGNIAGFVNDVDFAGIWECDTTSRTTFTDCTFTGKLIASNPSNYNGGFGGGYGDSTSVFMNNCLSAPSEINVGSTNNHVFCGNDIISTRNVYYTQAFGDVPNIAGCVQLLADASDLQSNLGTKLTVYGKDYYAKCNVVMNDVCHYGGQPLRPDFTVRVGVIGQPAQNVSATITDGDGNVVEAITQPGEYTITITGNENTDTHGTWSKTFTVKNGLAMDEEGNYIIANADDWKELNTMMEEGMTFENKTVKLANDITVTERVGSYYHPFRGTFDGDGHTLTFNYTATDNDAAPFQYIGSAVFKNMTVTGEISTDKAYTAGFVVYAYGNCAFENCVSNVTIHSTYWRYGAANSGFVACMESYGKTLTFTNCIFNGTFNGPAVTDWYPFVAWARGNTSNLVFNNCLSAPTSVYVAGRYATFYAGGTATLNGAYYTQTFGTAQGAQVFTEVQTSLCKKVTLFDTDYYAVCAIDGVQERYICHDGEPVYVDLVVTCGGKALAETDYTVDYTCNGEPVDAITTRGEYVVTITGNEETGCYGTAMTNFTVYLEEDLFVVNYDLVDSYGDGWGGCAIDVIEKSSATTVNTLTINDGKSASGELMLDAGKVYTFAWKAGSWASETSWTFNDGDGDLLFSGSGGSLSGGYTIYQLLTSARPRDLNVTEPEIGDFELSWQSYEGHHDSWDVAYKSNTATDFTVVEGVTSNPFTLENLPVATEYTFKVRGRKDGLTTKWSDEVKFTMCEAITLANNATNNGALIETNDGGLCNVTLADRTIYRDGDWNTIVLPFDVDLTDEDSPLYGATARTLASASLTNNGQTLTLNFDEPVTRLEAGVPYIIKWELDADIVNPTFEGVMLDATDGTFCSDDRLVRFVGTYDLVTFDDENKDVLFLGSGNNLYYPDGKATTTIGACRAYFKIGNDDFVADAAQLRSIVMDFGEESETVTIENVRVTPKEEIWFTLDGRRAKGNGRGMVVKTGSKRFVK